MGRSVSDGDSFEDTTLETVLPGLAVGRLAPPPDQVIAHTYLYWRYQTAPGRTAGTVEARNVDFGSAS